MSEVSSSWTKPPPRYTEASLVAELELAGVGRPSTYANTLKTLVDRRYVLLAPANAHGSDPFVPRETGRRRRHAVDQVRTGQPDEPRAVQATSNRTAPATTM